MLFQRSSMAKTPLRLSNTPGHIDKGYRGELIVAFDNLNDEQYTIKAGTKLIQAVAFDGRPIHPQIVHELDATERNDGAFG